MRKITLWLAVVLLLLSFTGCRKNQQPRYAFYYLRTADTIAFGQSDAVVAPVIREISGQSSDLTYLMRLYFDGPASENFQSPFPQGTQVLNATLEGDLLILEVSTQFSSLENIQLTMAGACLTATGYALTGAQSVQVDCEEETYLFHRSDYTFLDVIDTQSGKESQ